MKKCKESGYYITENIKIVMPDLSRPSGTSTEKEDDVFYKKVYIKFYGKKYCKSLLDDYTGYYVLNGIYMCLITRQGITLVDQVNTNYTIYLSTTSELKESLGERISKDMYIAVLKEALSYLRPEEDNYETISLLLENEEK